LSEQGFVAFIEHSIHTNLISRTCPCVSDEATDHGRSSSTPTDP